MYDQPLHDRPDEEAAPLQPFSEQQLDQLDALLSSSLPTATTEIEEAASLFYVCGYLTAQALSPQALPLQQWQSVLLETPLAPADADALQALLEAGFQSSAQGFSQGFGIELPFACRWDEENADFITDWSAGFLQAVFEQEAIWFAGQQEQTLAELLLPFMALSGLFSEEEDFAEIEEDPALLDAFAQQLPELLLDIYCQLNAPEEKPVAKKQPPAGRKPARKNTSVRKNTSARKSKQQRR